MQPRTGRVIAPRKKKPSDVAEAAAGGASGRVLVVRLVPVALVSSKAEAQAYIKERLGGEPGVMVTAAGGCPSKPAKNQLAALHAYAVARDAAVVSSLASAGSGGAAPADGATKPPRKPRKAQDEAPTPAKKPPTGKKASKTT